MQPQLIESMRARVCTIYRALTGHDVPEFEMTRSPETAAPETLPEEELTRSFAELEALVRTAPALAEKVPPFSFTPALDVIGGDSEWVIEVAVPGIERADITVECSNDTLIVSGIRRPAPESGSRNYSHTEIPYGPFYRDVHLPFPVRDAPAVELDEGLLRVRVRSAAQGTRSTQPEAPGKANTS
jgi:HSP20 family molecular chaperone IbpA